jgi:GcvH upstream region-like protein
MLDFFRKYQRYFFIVIAVVIVISFSFFGTFHTLNQPGKVQDKVLGRTIDGAKMMRSDVDKMIRFIATDRSDTALIEKGIMPNFFNPGIIRHDLMGSGVGILLAKAYFDVLKSDLTERMEHHKEFRPYVHPMAPFISAQNLWSQILPGQKSNLDRFLQETDEMTPDTFHLLVDLYLGETAFPSHILREYLMFQEKHYEWVQPDPALPRANLNLFRCTSIADWFGPRFLELSAQFILNAASYAKQKGYKVSYEEARVDLIKQGYETLQLQMRKGDVHQDQVAQLWKEQEHYLGVSEKEMVELWQNVMLFKRLFNDVGGAVFVDPHVYQTFYGFASKTAEVTLYHLPPTLELSDFSSLMKLEFYLDQVAENGKRGLALPQNLAPPSIVEKKCPDLVKERFVVEVAEVHIDEVALNVSLKEMWEWQLEKENYERLEKEFPKLALKKGEDAEGYYQALEGIDPELRQKIDKFSRAQIVAAHLEWIEEALSQKHFRTKELRVSKGGEIFPYGEKELYDLFLKAALKGELEIKSDALSARQALEIYSPDGKIYYSFHLLERDLEKKVLTFQEADQEGILDRLLEKHLENSYKEVRLKNPAVFKTETSDWKPFDEVKNEIGRILYSDRLKAIEKEVVSLGVSLPEGREQDLDDFYPKYRFFPYLVMAEKDIRGCGDQSSFLQEGGLWSLVKEEKVIKKHEKHPWVSSDVFSMVEKSWSNVGLSPKGSLCFFQLKEKSGPSGNFNDEMKQGQAILSREKEKLLMTELLELFKEKQVIHLTHDSAERP